MKTIFKLIMLICTMISLFGCSIEFVDDAINTQDMTTPEITIAIQTIVDTQTEIITTQTIKDITTIEETTVAYKSYTFRNSKLFAQHYEKHGAEMDCDSPEEYLQKANDVINNPNSLHKLEAEDNDHVYYLESTGEFVIVSTDGYIRTYYHASLDYYNRQ